MPEKIKVLIVDDSPEIRDVVHILLESEGYDVIEAADGAAAVSAVRENPTIDLIILDIMMPGMSGYEACTLIREISSAPVLFLSAKSQEMDKRDAYQSGGDDYLPKPFSGAELLMKVGSLLRRYLNYRGKGGDAITAGTIRLGEIEVDTVHHTVTKDGERITLTSKEFEILSFLAGGRGKTFSVKEIFEGVWHEQYFASSANTVMVHILNLRKKLETNCDNPQIVRTVWGKGYQID
ncbi:MAG: response regulator transcription factor [Ruminococcaceae bacterium]|nr:response regulator transcription factor [Oscillospiraceae bacterium]